MLRETLEDEAGHGFVRWVPGREIPGDGLTKWSANGSLETILFSGKWSLTDNEVAAELRRRVADRKRKRAQSGPQGVCVERSIFDCAPWIAIPALSGVYQEKLALMRFQHYTFDSSDSSS